VVQITEQQGCFGKKHSLDYNIPAFLTARETTLQKRQAINHIAHCWQVIKKSTFHNFIWLAVLLIMLWPQHAAGQDLPITARVDKANFFTNELVTLTVTVIDDSAQQPRPVLPRVDGLAVIDLDISTTVDIDNINGKIVTEVTYTYLLQPRRTGLLTIPPVSVRIDEEVFKTPPISINVSQGSTATPVPENEAPPNDVSPPADVQGEDFLIESEVDNLTPYVNQQIIHTFRSYQAVELSDEAQYEPPLFDKFETMGLPVREYNVEIDDRAYHVTEIRTALFPQTPGEVTIVPERLKTQGNAAEGLIDLYTDPLTVNVQPLPDNAPAGFTGAVGQYEMQAWVEPKTVIVYEPLSLFVSVSGTGNIHALPEPAWPNIENWRAYNTLSSLTADIQDDGLMAGVRTFERLIVPDHIGNFTIPPITMVYFDPATGTYQTIVTEPQPIKVVAPPGQAILPTAVTALPTATPVSIAADIPGTQQPDLVNPSLLGSLEESMGRIPIVGGIFVMICLLIPLAVIAGAGSFWWWQKRSSPVAQETEIEIPADPQQTHPLLAQTMQQYEDNYKVVNQALITYLETILGMPVSGLTRPEIARYLRRTGLDEHYVQRINDCLAQSEMGRYGPVTDDGGWSLMAEADELLFELDELFKESS